MKPAPPPLPTALQVEVTSACNLSCAMCLVSHRPPVNKVTGAMPMDRFRALVDEFPDLQELTLQGLGEPLLSPHLIEMIRYAKGRGTKVGFNSNAMLLNRRLATQLVDLGLDWLHVSLDGADADTFESIRSGASFERVVDNLAGLVEIRRNAGSETPWIRAVFVAMRRNVAQLPALVRLLSSIGVQELRVQNLSHSFSDTDPAGAYGGIRDFAGRESLDGAEDLAAPHFAEAAEVAATTRMELRLPDLEAHPAGPGEPGCTWPWDSAYVTSGGIVQPCCMVMGDDRVALGDVKQDSFEAIWSGEPYQEFRRQLLSDQPPAVCRGCAIYRQTF